MIGKAELLCRSFLTFPLNVNKTKCVVEGVKKVMPIRHFNTLNTQLDFAQSLKHSILTKLK